jgi:hypothetical protein
VAGVWTAFFAAAAARRTTPPVLLARCAIFRAPLRGRGPGGPCGLGDQGHNVSRRIGRPSPPDKPARRARHAQITHNAAQAAIGSTR